MTAVAKYDNFFTAGNILIQYSNRLTWNAELRNDTVRLRHENISVTIPYSEFTEKFTLVEN